MKIFEHTKTLVITAIAASAALLYMLSGNLDAKPLHPGSDVYYGPARAPVPFALRGHPPRINRPIPMPAAAHPPKHPATPTIPASATAPAGPPLTRIAIAGMQFRPALIHIKAGEQVTWVNHEPALHIISSPNYGLLASDRLAQGSMFTHTFKEPGAYTYYCTLHPQLMGIVIVE